MQPAACKIFQSTYLGDEGWDNMWRTIGNGKQPFKYVDRLEIAFADIDASDPDAACLRYAGGNHDRALRTIDEAKNQNPGIQIIAQMGWASGLAPLVEDETKAAARLDHFAKSIAAFLDDYKLKGIDFDWESVPDGMGKKTDGVSLSTYLFRQTRIHIGDDRLMTITPDGFDPRDQWLDIDAVNALFDAVICQSYERVSYIDSYVDAGIKTSILFCGICSEYDPKDPVFFPPNADIAKYTEKVKQYGLPGLYCWRLDNDDAKDGVPRYTITTKMWEYARGEKPQPPLFP
jgi:glycosyl hydrolase family 18 (putative chitinase)